MILVNATEYHYIVILNTNIFSHFLFNQRIISCNIFRNNFKFIKLKVIYPFNLFIWQGK